MSINDCSGNEEDPFECLEKVLTGPISDEGKALVRFYIHREIKLNKRIAQIWNIIEHHMQQEAETQEKILASHQKIEDKIVLFTAVFERVKGAVQLLAYTSAALGTIYIVIQIIEKVTIWTVR